MRWSFAGWAFSKEKISPSGQVRRPSGAPQLHICSTPSFSASASEHHDVWYSVFSWCLLSRVLPRGDCRRVDVSTVWRKSARILTVPAGAWGRCGGDCSMGRSYTLGFLNVACAAQDGCSCAGFSALDPGSYGHGHFWAVNSVLAGDITCSILAVCTQYHNSLLSNPPIHLS
jgi:hypothetical protein